MRLWRETATAHKKIVASGQDYPQTQADMSLLNTGDVGGLY